MKSIDNVLAIPEESGYLIGKPVQAFIGVSDLRVHGFLCQLFGLPARIIYCNINEGLVQINDSSIRLASSSRQTLLEAGEEFAFAENLGLVTLTGIPIFTRRDGFIGFLKDFELNPDDFSLQEVRTDDDRWTLLGNIGLNSIRDRVILLVDDVSNEYQRSNHYFFGKKVIQDVFQKAMDKSFQVGSYSPYGVSYVQR